MSNDLAETAQCHPYDCSGHGNCQNGQCQCQDQWSGPSCNSMFLYPSPLPSFSFPLFFMLFSYFFLLLLFLVRAQPIDVTINTTSPVLTVASSAKIFFISIKSISEVNSRGITLPLALSPSPLPSPPSSPPHSSK